MPRVWTSDETEAFVTFMEEVVVTGHKADNGQFKPGTFQLLARMMVEKFPDCGIDKRHIKNKHKRLKEKYQTAFDMLNCSGFGWNENKQCVDVDSKQVLEEWMRKHPNKYYTPGKPFPIYPRLEFVFGKGKATDAGAQDVADVVIQLESDETKGDAPTAPPPPAASSDPPGLWTTPTPTASVHLTDSVASSSNIEGNQQNKGKRKMRDIEVLESLVATFARAIDNSRENAKIIADAIAGHQILKLGEELGNLGFSTEEVVRVARIFSKNAQAGNLFWGLTADQKQAYVRSLLDDEL